MKNNKSNKVEDNCDRASKKQKSSNVDFVNDGLTTQGIRDIIGKIRDYVQKNRNDQDIAEKLKDDYSFFANRYPILYNMACDNNKFDFQSLEYFLNMRDKIISDKISSEEASKQIGQEWFNKYVDLPPK